MMSRMKAIVLMSAFACVGLWSGREALAVNPLPEEMGQGQIVDRRCARRHSAGEGHLPFSFLYDGKPAIALMKTWTFQHSVKAIGLSKDAAYAGWHRSQDGIGGAMRCRRIPGLSYGRMDALLSEYGQG